MCALFDDLIIFRFSNNMTEIKKLKLHLRTSYPPFFKFPVYSFGQKTPKRVNRERRTRPKCCDGRKENKKEKEKEASEADRPAQQNRRTGKADGRDRQPEGRGRDEGQRCRNEKGRPNQTGRQPEGSRTRTGEPKPGDADGRTENPAGIRTIRNPTELQQLLSHRQRPDNRKQTQSAEQAHNPHRRNNGQTTGLCFS